MPSADLSIDAVVTWVDGEDPDHKEKRDRYRCLPVRGSLKSATASTRFREVGELWYTLHLARLNAPWLRNIYLVTDNQRPDWLDDERKKYLGVKVVDHRAIFEGYEECLPTFNSQSIEAMLFRIPGLSERFIYLNDDVFIVRPVVPSEYFNEEKPIIRGRWVWRNPVLAVLERKVGQVKGCRSVREGLVGPRPERKRLRHSRYFRLAHAPYPINRKEFSRLFADEVLLRRTIRFRFRNSNQVWPVGYYANMALHSGLAIVKGGDWAYLSPEWAGRVNDILATEVARRASVKHLCIQSLDLFPREERKACLEFLGRLVEARSEADRC